MGTADEGSGGIGALLQGQFTGAAGAGASRIISYSAEEASSARKEHKIFFLAAELEHRRDNSANRKKVAEAVRKIMERELSPETRDIILRHLAGTAKSQIAKEMGVEVSTVARRYQQGMMALKRYCGCLERYLRRG